MARSILPKPGGHSLRESLLQATLEQDGGGGNSKSYGVKQSCIGMRDKRLEEGEEGGYQI